MASNRIDSIFATEAIAQVKKVKEELALTDSELINISKNAALASASIRGISAPSDLDSLVTNSNKLNEELDRQNKIIQGLQAQIKKLTEVKAANNKMSAEEAVNQRILNKNALDQAKTVSNLVGAYDKLSLAHQKAFKNAQNMGAQYGITSKKFLDASTEANRLDAELKALDANLGKYTRNVGNYSGGFNALGNSINQLTREAPAFANSINTGFMALSNNFPALFDAVQSIKQENKSLMEELKQSALQKGLLAKEEAILNGATEEAASAIGEQTTALAMSSAEGVRGRGVLRQMAGAFFSWSTLLSIGVTLLTLYGGQFIEWVGEMIKGKEVISDLKLRMQYLNKAFEEGGVKEAVTNVNELTINIGLAKKGFIDKEKVVKQYNESIGKTTGLVTSVDEAEKALVKNGDAYIKMMLYKAAANLALEEATKATLEAEKSRRKSLEEFKNTLEETNISAGGAGGLGTGAFNAQEYEKDKKRRIDAQKKRQQEEIEISQQAAQKNINIAKKFQEDAAKISKDMNFNFFSDTKEDKKQGTKAERAKKEAIELKSVADTISQINAKIAELQEKAIVGEGKSLLGMTNKEIAEYKEKNAVVIEKAKEDLADLIKLKTQLNALPAASTTILQPAKKEDVENLKELSQSMKDYLGNFTSDFINQSGFTNTFKILNDEIDGFGENASVTFNAIAESAQEAFNFISNASQANFDAEYSRLESQKENALKFAGEGTAARKKIEDDYEKKKKEVANRENKAKQKQAIFNIAIDTAQAVVASFIKDPTGITAAIIAALGAAQIGIVAAQKIPQYFDGGVHGGGLAMINDAGGSNYVETVVTPDGKVQQFKGRDVVTDLPKGTEIFTPEQWQQKELEYMLNSRGVMLNNQVSNGMTDELDRVMAKHFSKIQISKTVYDKKGFNSYVEYQGNKTIRNANRASGTGFNV
jgi:hypothetical protein